MIQARMSSGQFVLGLDARNLARLRAGEPIVADLSLLGGHDSVLIVYGETYQKIMDDLAHATGTPLPVVQPPGSRRQQ